MTASFIDTNLLLDFFDNTPKKPELIDCFRYGCLLNYCIFSELTNLIKNKFSTDKSFKSANTILTHTNDFEIVPITNQDKILALEIMQKFLDNNYSYTDSLILAQAQRLQTKVFARDKVMINYQKVFVEIPY